MGHFISIAASFANAQALRSRNKDQFAKLRPIFH